MSLRLHPALRTLTSTANLLLLVAMALLTSQVCAKPARAAPYTLKHDVRVKHCGVKLFQVIAIVQQDLDCSQFPSTNGATATGNPDFSPVDCCTTGCTYAELAAFECSS